MIRLFSGTPGSGKTLHAVHVMDWYNRHGKPVVSNFPLNESLLRNPNLLCVLDGSFDEKRGVKMDLKPDMLKSASVNWFRKTGKPVKEGELLLVIDECQLVFNTRDWQFNREWISFFTQHRKMGYDVILIAQYDRMIERQIRSLLEYECKHLKVSNLGGFWGLVMPLFMGRFHVYEKWYTSGNMVISHYRASYSGRDKRLYDTFKVW